MCSLAANKWTGPPPFTVISTTCDMVALYFSTEGNQPFPENFAKFNTWRKVVAASGAWKQRDRGIYEGLQNMYRGRSAPKLKYDLDKNAVNLLIVDHAGDEAKNAALLGSLLKMLARDLPSLCAAES